MRQIQGKTNVRLKKVDIEVNEYIDVQKKSMHILFQMNWDGRQNKDRKSGLMKESVVSILRTIILERYCAL